MRKQQRSDVGLKANGQKVLNNVPLFGRSVRGCSDAPHLPVRLSRTERSFYFQPSSLRERSRNLRCAINDVPFSRWAFTRFHHREVVENPQQAVTGLATMDCYPPQFSKPASYPREFGAMRLYQNRSLHFDAAPYLKVLEVGKRAEDTKTVIQ